jgi:transposase InsO family protein
MIHRGDTRADVVLGRIFSDVCGRFTKSHDGYEYFVTWVDDKSRKVFINGIKLKSEVGERLKAFVERAELETGQRIVALRSDGGSEYTSNNVRKYLKGKGVKHEITTPDTLQHNGVAECMNRTLLNMVRAMLNDAELPDTYWHDALQYAAHIHNISPTQALDDITPEEAWSGNKPDISPSTCGCNRL